MCSFFFQFVYLLLGGKGNLRKVQAKAKIIYQMADIYENHDFFVSLKVQLCYKKYWLNLQNSGHVRMTV